MRKMEIRKLLLSATALLVFCLNSFAKDYDAKDFGAKNDGVTLNSAIVQAAIDYISENGGGRLVFDPGIYIMGSVYLKSGVTLHLKKGSELRSSGNGFDFVKDKYIGWMSMIFAVKQDNIGITGEGMINGMGFTTANSLLVYAQKGLFVDAISYDRVKEDNRPTNIYFRECNNVTITGITLKDPADWNQVYDQCKNSLCGQYQSGHANLIGITMALTLLTAMGLLSKILILMQPTMSSVLNHMTPQKFVKMWWWIIVSADRAPTD